MKGWCLAAIVITVSLWPAVAMADQAAPPSTGQPSSVPDIHAGHGAPTPPAEGGASEPLPSFIPAITDEDRAAAFPEVGGHTAHDTRSSYMVLFDELEVARESGRFDLSWDTEGWVGGDVRRFRFRSQGSKPRDARAGGDAHVLYGHAFARWWELVAGIRQDFKPGNTRTWAAFGVQGLAPYWFHVEASGYLGTRGAAARIETKYELLITNRLILQPTVEADFASRSDDGRKTGRGLESTEAGIRLRWELRRELAPYLGVSWRHTFFGTARRLREAGEPDSNRQIVFGVRAWL